MENSKEKPVDKNPQDVAIENKIRNVMDLPEEILLKIMGHLSTSDILKKMAPVCKRFYRLSRDKNLVKQIKFKSLELSFHQRTSSWTEERKEKYYSDFFEVLGNAQKLKMLSVYLDQSSMRKFYVNWLDPSVNQHRCLEEFRIYFKLSELESYTNFLEYGVFQVLNCCPKLKILKIKEFRLNVYPQYLKKFLKTITENVPQIQIICLALYLDLDIPIYLKVCKEIAFENNIKIELQNVRSGSNLTVYKKSYDGIEYTILNHQRPCELLNQNDARHFFGNF